MSNSQVESSLLNVRLSGILEFRKNSRYAFKYMAKLQRSRPCFNNVSRTDNFTDELGVFRIVQRERITVRVNRLTLNAIVSAREVYNCRVLCQNNVRRRSSAKTETQHRAATIVNASLHTELKTKQRVENRLLFTRLFSGFIMG